MSHDQNDKKNPPPLIWLDVARDRNPPFLLGVEQTSIGIRLIGELCCASDSVAVTNAKNTYILTNIVYDTTHTMQDTLDHMIFGLIQAYTKLQIPSNDITIALHSVLAGKLANEHCSDLSSDPESNTKHMAEIVTPEITDRPRLLRVTPFDWTPKPV